MNLPAWNITSIARGPWLQLYLDSMGDRGVDSMIAECKRLGMPGVLFHGGPRSMPRRAARCVATAKTRGVAFGFALGADGEVDSDGSRLTVEEKADALALLDEQYSPALNVVNAEITWDTDTGDQDDMDEAGAIRMGKRFRARRPNAIVVDQPWFAIDSHGEERKTARPIEAGGTFAGFPSDEFASWIQARFPQLYYRNFGTKDPGAYRRVAAWHKRDWDKHELSLARLNLVRPRSYTLQGYGHHERPQDFVHSLLVVRDRPSILWWDHEYVSRWQVTAACISAVNQIVRGGHAPDGRDPVECVSSWQLALGMTEAEADGACGWMTLERSGIARRPAPRG